MFVCNNRVKKEIHSFWLLKYFISFFQDRYLAVGDLGGNVETLDIETKQKSWGLRGHEVDI